MQEPFRYLFDDFVIQFCQDLRKKDFTVKSESASRRRKGKREYLIDAETRRMMKELNGFFKTIIEVPLIRRGNKQRIETLINEAALLLAKYLRGETKTWIPRVTARAIDRRL